jgi:hypothetical protein
MIVVNATEDHGFTTIISEGGNFKSPSYTLYENDKIEVKTEVKTGGPVDVYLMTNEQYQEAYDHTFKLKLVISYFKGAENVKTSKFSYKVPEQDSETYDYYDEYFDELYVIVDNRECNLTANDADPTGSVEVIVSIEIDRDNRSGFDSLDYAFYICFTVFIVLLVIIVSIIYFTTRRRDRRNVTTPGYEPDRTQGHQFSRGTRGEPPGQARPPIQQYPYYSYSPYGSYYSYYPYPYPDQDQSEVKYKKAKPKGKKRTKLKLK